MSHGRTLLDTEKAVIESLPNKKHSMRSIARMVGQSTTAVWNIIRQPFQITRRLGMELSQKSLQNFKAAFHMLPVLVSRVQER